LEFKALGDIYYYGNGFEIDYLKAREYYLKAAEQSDSLQSQARAIKMIGDSYFYAEVLKLIMLRHKNII